ncbi:MAG TPA: hypothetical protein VG204_13130 [Terriglobia bacterium]|nr:hypothetical protein [Terriglobia bacterium]
MWHEAHDPLGCYLLGASVLTPAQRAVRRAPTHAGFDTGESVAAPTLRPRISTKPFDRDQVQREADELVSLARSVARDAGQAQKGVRPKGLSANLRKIERLAKQLRRELRI